MKNDHNNVKCLRSMRAIISMVNFRIEHQHKNTGKINRKNRTNTNIIMTGEIIRIEQTQKTGKTTTFRWGWGRRNLC